MSVRVHAIAKEVNKTGKELIEILRSVGMILKVHLQRLIK